MQAAAPDGFSGDAGRRPRLAFVYHPFSFDTMAIAAAAHDVCDLVWVIDTAMADVARMTPLLRRLGPIVEVAGLSLPEVAAAVGEERPDGILALADGRLVWTAELAGLLGLPCNEPAVAARLADKLLQRTALAAGGLPVPGIMVEPRPSPPHDAGVVE